jgi:hypothetical protein
MHGGHPALRDGREQHIPSDPRHLGGHQVGVYTLPTCSAAGGHRRTRLTVPSPSHEK